MSKKSKEEVKSIHITHFCCPKRLRKEGGNAQCCICFPHEKCEFKENEWKEKQTVC